MTRAAARVAAALGAGALSVLSALAVVAPAAVAQAPAPQPCAPAGGSTPTAFQGGLRSPVDNFQTATTSVEVNGEFALGDNVAEVRCVSAQVRPLEEQGTDTVVKRVEGDQGSLEIEWAVPDRTWNGEYQLTVVVVGRNRPTPLSAWTNRHQTITRSFWILAPPAIPDAVTVDTSTGGKAKVTWKRSPEPDVFAYALQRVDDRGRNALLEGPRQPVSGDTVEFVDTPGAAGVYQYSVRAVRPGLPGEPVFSDASPPVEANVAATPGPTTTAPAGGSGGAGSGSGGGGGAAAPGGSASTGGGSSSSTRSSRVDLSSFGALLDQRRQATTPAAPVEPDPGFDETLPFQPGDEPALAEDDGAELGIDEPDQGVGQRTIRDDGDRRRTFAAIAGAMFMFALFMHARWLLGQADAADLEAAAPGDDVDAAAPGGAAAGTLVDRRELRRRARRERIAATTAASGVPTAPAPIGAVAAGAGAGLRRRGRHAEPTPATEPGSHRARDERRRARHERAAAALAARAAASAEPSEVRPAAGPGRRERRGSGGREALVRLSPPAGAAMDEPVPVPPPVAARRSRRRFGPGRVPGEEAAPAEPTPADVEIATPAAAAASGPDTMAAVPLSGRRARRRTRTSAPGRVDGNGATAALSAPGPHDWDEPAPAPSTPAPHDGGAPGPSSPGGVDWDEPAPGPSTPGRVDMDGAAPAPSTPGPVDMDEPAPAPSTAGPADAVAPAPAPGPARSRRHDRRWRAATPAAPAAASPAPAAPRPAPAARADEWDAPELDVPLDPPPVARRARRGEVGQRARTSTRSAHGRGTAQRIPPRPADDRGEGGASVRARRRGAGGRDRRLPVR